MQFELEAEAFEYFGELEFEAAGAKKKSVYALGDDWRKWVQKTLAATTRLKVGSDGKFGGGTITALKAFQTANGLPATGLLTLATIAKLQQLGGAEPQWVGESVRDAPPKHITDRCTGGGRDIPAIKGVIALNSINGLRFEYTASNSPVSIGGGLKAIPAAGRQPLRVQEFIGKTKTRLEAFFRAVQQQGLQVDTILTAGGFVQRCISKTNTASDHSFAEAFDLAGIRWVSPPPGAQRETIVYNFANATELKQLMRINALLRQHFPNVLDYNTNVGHQDHFHVDNGGDKLNPHAKSSIRWLHHALEAVVGGKVVARPKPHTAFPSKPGKALYALMAQYLGKPTATAADIPTAFTRVTAQIAEGRF